MKGIILAGGTGSRLHPLTLVTSKQLLPVYDKPMIYYPLSVLMMAGIKEILIITTPDDLSCFRKLLGSGERYGITLSYASQPKPEGLAQAFTIGESFIGKDDVCLILGDNIFYGAGLIQHLEEAKNTVSEERKAVIFGYTVKDPERYGVAEIGDSGSVISITEKPEKPKSKNAVVGLYFYPNEVIDISKKITPSERGELEITSVNQQFLTESRLKIQLLGRGYAWLDTGTHEALSEATDFVKTIEKRTGLKIACLEEVSYMMGLISKEQLLKLADRYTGEYKSYLVDRAC